MRRPVPIELTHNIRVRFRENFTDKQVQGSVVQLSRNTKNKRINEKIYLGFKEER